MFNFGGAIMEVDRVSLMGAFGGRRRDAKDEIGGRGGWLGARVHGGARAPKGL
jgi:hypothetical protein